MGKEVNLSKHRRVSISVVIFDASILQNNGDFSVKMLATFTKIYDSKQNDDGHFTRFVGLDCAAI